MSIKMATWLPGNGVQPEHPPLSQRRMAGSGLFGGTDVSTNWFQFPITTPVIIDDRRPLLTRAFVLYRMRFCAVLSVQLWSGGERKAVFSVAQESGNIRDHADVDRSQGVEDKSMFSIEPLHGPPMEFGQGLSISVNVQFDSRERRQGLFAQFRDVSRNIGTIEFFSAGADWESA